MMQDPRAPNMPWLSVYLTVQDAQKSVSFYEKAFGFALGDVMKGEDGSPQHVEMKYKGEICVMFAPEGAFGSPHKSPVTSGIEPTSTMVVYTDDVDALYTQAKTAGATVEQAPEDMFWGDRVTKLRCLNGYMWLFATHKGQPTH